MAVINKATGIAVVTCIAVIKSIIDKSLNREKEECNCMDEECKCSSYGKLVTEYKEFHEQISNALEKVMDLIAPKETETKE